MVAELKKLGWPIIVGCHVGETSLLTRAALVVTAAAGESLVAHEGAYGDYLVEREPAQPMLKFGHGGLLDLRSPYYLKTVQGLQVIPVKTGKPDLACSAECPRHRMMGRRTFVSGNARPV